MDIGCYTTNLRNVGDDLNSYILPKLFPKLYEVHPSHVLIGIGSILDHRFSEYKNKVVFGSGARGADTLPKFDDSWDIRFVRGPCTAAAISAQTYNDHITDPALLISNLYRPAIKIKSRIGIIPYFRSNHTAWKTVAEYMDYDFISPRLGVESFVNAVANCEYVLAEAMHGAIVADALRVPWLPFCSYSASHENETHIFKWRDWCQSVKIEFDELVVPILWSEDDMTGFKKLKRDIKIRYICSRLKSYANINQPFLSDSSVFSERLMQLEDAAEHLRKDYGV